MKKKILSVLTIILMISMLVLLTGCGDDSEKSDKESSATQKETVEEFLKYVENGKYKKASDLVDWLAVQKLSNSFYKSYENIEEMTSKERKKYEDDYESYIEYKMESFLDYESDFEDYEKFKINANIGKATKVEDTKKVYEVPVDIEIEYEDEDGDEDTVDDEITFYLMKDDGEYKIIDGVIELESLLSDIAYGW